MTRTVVPKPLPRASLAGHVRAFSRWLCAHVRRTELVLLGAVCLVGALLWGFVAIADEVMEGSTHAMDEAIFMALHDADGSPWGPRWLEEVGRDLTALGGVAVITIVSLSVVGFLAFHRRWREVWSVALPLAAGIALSNLLKFVFERPRPDLVPHLSETYTSSFPSGHAMMAAVTWLTLGALVAEMSSHRRMKLYVVGIAVLVVLLVGVSRVYVGVHWPTDVLAGWTVGAMWSVVCWLVVRYVDMRQGQRHDIIDEHAARVYDEALGASQAQRTRRAAHDHGGEASRPARRWPAS